MAQNPLESLALPKLPAGPPWETPRVLADMPCNFNRAASALSVIRRTRRVAGVIDLPLIPEPTPLHDELQTPEGYA